MNGTKIIAILKDKVKPALGCTEPVAVALAVARAYAHLNGDIQTIDVAVSPNIYKNGMWVGIPGTRETGIPFAVALAVVCGQPELELEVFRYVNDTYIRMAKSLLEREVIKVGLEVNKSRFYIRAEVTTDQGKCHCIIENSHTNIVLIEKNDQILFRKDPAEGPRLEKKEVEKLGDLTIKQLRKIIETIPVEDIAFLEEGGRMNMEMARVGLQGKFGLGLGAGLNELIETGDLEKNLINRVRVNTAAATDARMAGSNLPVMSSAGSGNHGIIAIIPPFMVCQEMGYDREKQLRAIAFSHLVTILIKEFTGSLSPVCGCAIAAGIGASVSVAWLIGCTDDQIAGAINNMSGSLAGMVCDGAKGGCALKLSTASSEAILSAKLAKNNIFISNHEGIVNKGAETTIQNLGKLCVQGMEKVDQNIIEVMLAC